MSIGDAVALTALSAGAFVGSPQMLKLWRHTTTRYDRKPKGLPWGDPTWHGVVRAMPTFTAAGVLLIVAAWLLEFRRHGPVAAIASVLFFMMLFAVLLGAVIMFWNRPRFLVPPDRRRERGMLQR